MQKIFKGLFRKYFQRIRIFIYSFLSDSSITVSGLPIIKQPIVFKGKGKLIFRENVQLGYNPSPSFYSEVAYIEARNSEDTIIFGTDVFINNTVTIISENGTISIGDNTLIGDHVRIINSDFHSLNPNERTTGIPLSANISIGNNVFIGSNVTITKGVSIGENSVIGICSVVTKNIPNNCIAVGTPAKIIRNL
ncbi:MAG: acyltransferase [Bacteroidetes bacterium]|nr:MAG: acyltransferase [Bacteroidota bacterium]MBL1145810.1 acyltransferase [Bacteroidota bacterium]NOG58604.1 acyltransferase [Bacteroidota bacterium]